MIPWKGVRKGAVYMYRGTSVNSDGHGRGVCTVMEVFGFMQVVPYYPEALEGEALWRCQSIGSIPLHLQSM